MPAKKKGKNYMKGKYLGPKYPTKADGKIPAFSSYEEEANFWDTHSFTEFEDQLEDVELVFELDKPRDASLVLRLQKTFKKSLEKIAKGKGLDVSTLARMWLAERLQKEIKTYYSYR